MKRTIIILLTVALCSVEAFGQSMERRVDNIASFAKTYGVARWFVPSDEAAGTDWNQLAVEGVGRISDCTDSDELADSLESVFDDMIPMFSVDYLLESEVISRYYAADHSDSKPIRWQHLGVDLGPESHDYISRRTNRPYDTKNTSRFAFTGYVRSEESDTDSVRLEVVCRGYDSPDPVRGCFHFCTWTNTEEYITPLYRVDPLTEELGQDWAKVSMTLELPDKISARYINWGIFPDGDGKISVQSVRIYTGSGKEIYSLDCTKGYDYVGEHCWLGYRTYNYIENADGLTAVCRDEVFKDTESRNLINLPVADGLYAHIPLLLYDGYDKPEGKKAETQCGEYSEEDRDIADIIVMWNVIRYFSPYLYETGIDWDMELRKAVCAVLDGEDGLRALKRMVALIKDAHVYYPNEQMDMNEKVLPAVIDHIDNMAVVRESMNPALQPGDILETAEGKDVTEYVVDQMQLFSAGDHTAASWLYQVPFPLESEEAECRIVRNGKKLGMRVPAITKAEYFRSYWTNYYSNEKPSQWLNDDVCYINLSNTSFNAIGDMLEKRTDDDYVIIDMRKRSSGFITREILQYIAPDLVYRYIPYYNPKSSFPEVKKPSYKEEYASPMCKTPEEHIIFLSGPRNISNEEIFLDFVKHRGVGTIVGENSAGISGAINTATLPSGLKVSFSGQRAYSNSGMEEDYFVTGVTPHIVVNTTVKDLAEGNDPQLEAALRTIDANKLTHMFQQPQIVGGYLLDGKDSFEELDAAVLTESKSKEKKLEGKGMKLPGGCMVMTPRSIGKEIGSIVQAQNPFLVKSISFTVDENRMEGCRADIRIYRIHDENDLENIVTMPIYQEIPKADIKTTFSVAPTESILLEPGEYYVSFSLTDIDSNIMERWADSDTWSDKEQSTKYMEDRIYFPVYVKTSYTRNASGEPLTKWGANIGLSVQGIER